MKWLPEKYRWKKHDPARDLAILFVAGFACLVLLLVNALKG